MNEPINLPNRTEGYRIATRELFLSDSKPSIIEPPVRVKIQTFVDEVFKSHPAKSRCQPELGDDKAPKKLFCQSCQALKTSFDFHRNKSKKHGIETQCKACTLARKARKARIWESFNSEVVEMSVSFKKSPHFERGLQFITEIICEEILG